jgi:hypothetical protein
MKRLRALWDLGGPMLLCYLPFPALAVYSTYAIWDEGHLFEAKGILGAGIFWFMAIGLFWLLTSTRILQKNRLTWGMLLQAFLAALPAGLIWEKSWIHHLDLHDGKKRRPKT